MFSLTATLLKSSLIMAAVAVPRFGMAPHCVSPTHCIRGCECLLQQRNVAFAQVSLDQNSSVTIVFGATALQKYTAIQTESTETTKQLSERIRHRAKRVGQSICQAGLIKQLLHAPAWSCS